jgi:hypothetical protein
MSWSPAAHATRYDLVSGALSTLRSASGAFSAGTTNCALGGVAATSALVADADPPPGDGAFYLLRAIGSECRGTYDDGSPSQVGGRDAGIASAGDCP